MIYNIIGYVSISKRRMQITLVCLKNIKSMQKNSKEYMKLKIISAYNEEFKEISDLSFPTVESFCLKNSFDCERFFIEDFGKPAPWFKIPTLIKEIDSNEYDYILWIDADAMILNQNFDIKQILDENKSLHISHDPNSINSGAMLWKCDKVSRGFLKEVWKLSEKYLNHIWWEQAAIIELLASE